MSFLACGNCSGLCVCGGMPRLPRVPDAIDRDRDITATLSRIEFLKPTRGPRPPDTLSDPEYLTAYCAVAGTLKDHQGMANLWGISLVLGELVTKYDRYVRWAHPKPHSWGGRILRGVRSLHLPQGQTLRYQVLHRWTDNSLFTFLTEEERRLRYRHAIGL